jgi:hypothetical protein
MTVTTPDTNDTVYPFRNALYSDEDFVENGKVTPLGVEYLSQFKQFGLFTRTRTALLFLITLPITVPLAIFRLVSLVVVFGTGIVLKKYLSVSLDNYPKLIALIYFVCLGVCTRSKEAGRARVPLGADPRDGERCTVIVSNHNARFDAMLLSNLHQSDTTYLAAARSSFFGKLLIDSGLCSRSMEEGIALDTKEGRKEWRRRLDSAGNRSLLFFPEGRVVQTPNTIITFQTHLLQGQKIRIVCKKSNYTSYFLDHSQIEIPFFKAPWSRLKHKLFWDSIMESIPFLLAIVTVFHTEVLGTLLLNGNETPEEIRESLYSLYCANGYSLVTLDKSLVKKLMHTLYL